MEETKVVNGADSPVPVKQVSSFHPVEPLADAYSKVGPNGFYILLSGVILLAFMSMFWVTLKFTLDNLNEQLKTEQHSSEVREEKLIIRADNLAKDHYERWEKAREKNMELAADVKALNAKVDVLMADLKALSIYLKLAKPEEKKGP